MRVTQFESPKKAPPSVSSGEPASFEITPPKGLSDFKSSQQLRQSELINQFSGPDAIGASSTGGRTIQFSPLPTLQALQDGAVAAPLIERASNPYHNHRSPVRRLSLNATALNCVLETASRELFEKLSPTHREILTQCSTNPETFPSADYAIAPYALKPGRVNGDIFVSELARSDLSYKAIEMTGSPARLSNAGADAPYGFLLMHKDTPIAAVSYVVAEGPSLLVVMTQRLRHQGFSPAEHAEAKNHEKAAKRLHLKEAMLSLCSSIASTLGCSSITYQGANNNRWVHEMVSKGGDDGWDSICVPRMKLEDAKNTYDTFCLAHGFTLDQQSGNFVKKM